MTDTIKKVKVLNMNSPSSGNAVKNQFIIETYDNNGYLEGRYFQSYTSVIAGIVEIKGEVKTYLDKSTWDYSVTTGRYRNQFLGESKKETERKIKSGEYILTDLN